MIADPRHQIRSVMLEALFEPAPPAVFTGTPGLAALKDRTPPATVFDVLVRSALWAMMKNKRFANTQLLETFLARCGGKVALPLVKFDELNLSPEQQARQARRWLQELEAEEREQAAAPLEPQTNQEEVSHG